MGGEIHPFPKTSSIYLKIYKAWNTKTPDSSLNNLEIKEKYEETPTH